ncbi:DUF368 domain-containing protein [Psychrobacter sp. I-STPA6b]|uniref:DUF368 domain-containing protein n=1 Tax=Psychrobacter sp. I-STPA6b TaxID=2585718 RepID=UPI002223070A|nr:DUF368 domain-containing protein [Psychrobacter sp. I-STPA6b]
MATSEPTLPDSSKDTIAHPSIQPIQSPSNSPKQLFAVYLKGMAMGSADIVPGVSGGTIALITGIYERLINALSQIGIGLIPLLRQHWQQHGLASGIKAVWQQVDATFLLCLIAGIATSFISLAGAIKYLLDNQPLLIWSFFFGLVIATVFILLTEVKRWTVARVSLFVIGAVLAVFISQAPILNTGATPSLPYLFFAGAIAICAMILPGISGSFILLLLGAYDAVLQAVHDWNFSVIFSVASGMVAGLLVFTRLLKWLLQRYYQGTLALLTGFIAGSLVKIWPWRTESLGNLAPWQYFNIMATQPENGQIIHWSVSLILIIIGAVAVTVLSWWGQKTKAHK